MKIVQYEYCSWCYGFGYLNDHSYSDYGQVCPRCNGTGYSGMDLEDQEYIINNKLKAIQANIKKKNKERKQYGDIQRQRRLPYSHR